MRILDRERYWAFLKAYVICFIALVGLYVVIDAFSNFDEFTKIDDGMVGLFGRMGKYYLIRMSEFYDRLCGVISMMAAIFTVTWMQKNNELLAMLAAGIGTKRIIRPVIVSSVIVSSFAVLNQELIMPEVAEDLQKSHDDDGVYRVNVTSRDDSNGVQLEGDKADRAHRTVFKLVATFPSSLTGQLFWVNAAEALYIPPNDPKAPRKGGWLLRGAKLSPPSFAPKTELLVKLDRAKDAEELAMYPATLEKLTDLDGDVFFLNSDLAFATVTRKRDWYRFASSWDLLRSLSDPTCKPEKNAIAIALHGRTLRPLLGLNLMFLSLPLVLGGTGRNMFVNLAMSLGTSGLFYGSVFLASHLADSEAITPELAAWAPLMGFGVFAVLRWDTIRT